MATSVAHDAQLIQQALTRLEEQMSKMGSAASSIENTSAGLQAHYHASSSTIFVQRMNDWTEQYNKAAHQVNRLHEALTEAMSKLTSAEGSAAEYASGWSPTAGVDDISSISSVLSGA
ncbi:hypothetical protein OG599_15105 [Streptomyces sp. NBC_01335]|uniref:hypothetical protein n=1 Tax=Streptomyces sp. NBC_01335 TaxID=2903828 RepID=UPI002E16615B|nr:hypothetical protein OG599_15105 [Streptomyces sp. NBC_01335]